KIADPADHRGSRDDDVGVCCGRAEELAVLRISDHHAEAWVVIKRMANRTVLAEVVHAGDVVPCAQELVDEVSADEASGPGEKDAHPRYSLMPPPRRPQTSTTSLPLVTRF